jgi:AcrR family transcriptional regulator
VTPIDAADIGSDPRVSRTRSAVLSAAIELLAERGYSGFSVDAVVARTGVAKTTIYRHWPTRADLLTAVITQLDGRAGAEGAGGAAADSASGDSASEDSAELPDSGSVREDLLLFFAGRVRVAGSRQWQRCMPALVEASARDAGLAEVITALTARYVGQVAELLRRGRNRGELRSDISLELAAAVLIGPFVFRQLLLGQRPTGSQVSAVLDMLLSGIGQAGPA